MAPASASPTAGPTANASPSHSRRRGHSPKVGSVVGEPSSIRCSSLPNGSGGAEAPSVGSAGGAIPSPSRRRCDRRGCLPHRRLAGRDRGAQPELLRRRRPDHLGRRLRRPGPGAAGARGRVPRADHPGIAHAEGRRRSGRPVRRGRAPGADDVARQRLQPRRAPRLGQAGRAGSGRDRDRLSCAS